ncbi:ATP-binding protein [Peribacillus saganii]|uniref:histidine kinase n=1 Tax=Peribacillus saganii TaxID=2303992 RepID=A0A372LRF3_9BACI|nr:ATP-binding protein [Peribacillus saganii]RFU70799.1 ATP-binding protein [Peribacillus saganii]
MNSKFRRCSLIYNKEHGEVEISSTIHKNGLVVNIMDTGAGIAAEEYPKLFVPFYRVDDTNSEEMGIGFSLVKTLVQTMGGSNCWFSIPMRIDEGRSK